MNNTIKFSIDSKNSGKRLDVFLTENMSQFTRSFLKKLIDQSNRAQLLIEDLLKDLFKLRYSIY